MMQKASRGDVAAWPLLLTWLIGCTGIAPGNDSTVVVLEGRLQRMGVTRAGLPDPTRPPAAAHLLETAEGARIELLFPAPVDLPTGTVLRVEGASGGGEAPSLGWERRLRVARWQELGRPAAQALVLDPAAPPPMPRKVAVVLLNFMNDRSEINPTIEQVKAQVFTDPRSTAVFYKEQSYGRVLLGGKANPAGDVFGYYTVPFDNTPCRQDEWSRSALEVAAAAGADVTGYDHYVFIFPNTSACGYAGLGQQPGSRTWINGLRPEAKRVHHELGHNFNLYHASSLACTGAAGERVTLSDSCTRSEYGNPFDIMGNGPRQTNVYNKARGRWIAGSNITEVAADGVYDLHPAELPSNEPQMLRVPRTADQSFYIEYRQPLGVFDDFPPTDPAVNGIILLYGPTTMSGAGAGLLDTNPQTPTFTDAPLGVGRSFFDGTSKVRITLVERSPQVAKVRVELAAAGPLDGGVPPSGAPDGSPPPRPPPDAGAQMAPDAGPVAPPDAAGTDEPTPMPSGSGGSDARAGTGGRAGGGCGCGVGGRPAALALALALALAVVVLALARRSRLSRRAGWQQRRREPLVNGFNTFM